MKQADCDCPFCQIDATRIRRDVQGFIVIRDAYPISPGHTLVVPKRHVLSWFDLAGEEVSGLHAALQWARGDIEADFQPDGYNLGVNDGSVAGQTVSHLHIHLIPRYKGDCQDPRGGIRWLFPDKAKYWDE